MNLNSASFAPVDYVWAYESSSFASKAGAKVGDFCTSIDFCTARLNSGAATLGEFRYQRLPLAT